MFSLLISGMRKSNSINLLMILIIALVTAVPAFAASPITLSWVAPTLRTNNSALNNLAGFRLYYRTPTGAYSSSNRIDINNPSTLNITVTTLTPGHYYFVVRAIDSDNLESGNSNEVNGFVSNPLLPKLQTGIIANRSFAVQLFNDGATTPFYSQNLTADAAGKIHLPPTIILPAVFDVRIKTAGFLARKITKLTAANTTIFPTNLAGDIFDDNIINTLDFNIVSGQWLQRNLASDINGDGVTNSLDFSFISSSWLQRGE